MSNIQLLSDSAVDDALEQTAVRHLFRYQLNPATIGTLLVLGGICFILAGYLFFGPGLGGVATAGFVGAILAALTFFSMASFWGNFGANRFVAITDDYLFVGDDENAWRIHWSLVDRDALNFDEMKSSRFRGNIAVDTAGQSIDIPLYTPFVYIEDLEGLMFELLQRLDTEGGEAPVGAPDRDLDEQELFGDDDPDDSGSA